MGNFLWKFPSVRAPRCAFFRQPSRSATTFFGQRRSRAALRLQNSPARFLHGQPPYTNIALCCRRHRSTICGRPALPQRAVPSTVAPPKLDSAYGAHACGGYTFYSDMQGALQIPRPLPSTRPAVCPALRVRISGNASATRTPGSRARCRDGSPCPADLVPAKMRAALDSGTGVAEALRKTGLRRAPGASRKSGRYPASRATSGVAAMDSINVIHSALRTKPVFSTQKAPPAPGQRQTVKKPWRAQAGRNPPNLLLPLSARRRKHSTSIDAPPEGPATSASPHKKRRPLPGSACFAICTFRHVSLSSAPSPVPAWAWRSAPAPPARRASGGRRRRCLSWPRCRYTA